MFKNADDVIAGMDSLLNKKASGGEMLFSRVDRQGFIKVKQNLDRAGDKQSSDLMREILRELTKRLSIDDSTERAINRLAQVARDGQRWDVALVRNNVFKVANELGLKLPSMMFASEDKTAGNDSIFGYDRGSDIEFFFDPWKKTVEIGMGGEWWGGPVKMGKNVYSHRKERVDPAYRPVTVNVEKLGHGLRFAVMGGFGGGHTFVLGFKGM